MKVNYTTTILKFGDKGEKTGWTYIEVPPDVANRLKPGNKKSFRVKGKLDGYAIQKIAIMPMGDGGFIMPVNAVMRKGIGKRHGAMLNVFLEEDKNPLVLDSDLMDCLNDELDALKFFQTLPKSHQNYFSKWITGAKTEPTKAKRIAQAVNALMKNKGFTEMVRSFKKDV